jgi:hypothetical protein
MSKSETQSLKRFRLLILPFLLVSNIAFSQCNCSGSSYGTGIFDQGGGFLNENQAFSAQFSYESRFFSPHEHEDGHHHVHTSDTTAIEEADIANLTSTNVALIYQPSSKWLFLVQIPYLRAASNLGVNAGNGDLSLLVGYGIIQKEKHKVFLLAGMENPTGKVMAMNENPVVQYGSGGFDPMLGISYGTISKRWRVLSNFLYKHTAKNHHGDNMGKTIQTNVSGLYALIPSVPKCNNDSVSELRKNISWNAGITVNWEHYGMQIQDNMNIALSGGDLCWAGVSSILNYKKFTLPVLVSIPFYQHWQAENQLANLRWRVGLGYTF